MRSPGRPPPHRGRSGSSRRGPERHEAQVDQAVACDRYTVHVALVPVGLNFDAPLSRGDGVIHDEALPYAVAIHINDGVGRVGLQPQLACASGGRLQRTRIRLHGRSRGPPDRIGGRGARPRAPGPPPPPRAPPPPPGPRPPPPPPRPPRARPPPGR